MWEMIVCIGITWAGCGSVHQPEFRSKDDCFQALAGMKVMDNGKNSTQGNGRQLVAYCRPKQGWK